MADLIDEAAADIRGAIDAGAVNVQIDFTEGRLSLKLDPSGEFAAQLRGTQQPSSRPVHF